MFCFLKGLIIIKVTISIKTKLANPAGIFLILLNFKLVASDIWFVRINKSNIINISGKAKIIKMEKAKKFDPKINGITANKIKITEILPKTSFALSSKTVKPAKNRIINPRNINKILIDILLR